MEYKLEHTEAELTSMLRRMRELSDWFYTKVVSIECHPFVEFTGFMNEYVKICEDSMKRGVEFPFATGHSGEQKPLQIASHQAKYLGEKFNCILGPAFRADPAAWEAFKQKAGLP